MTCLTVSCFSAVTAMPPPASDDDDAAVDVDDFDSARTPPAPPCLRNVRGRGLRLMVLGFGGWGLGFKVYGSRVRV